MTTAKLSVYIGRHKVVVVDDLIDPKNATNVAFLTKHGGIPEVKTGKPKATKSTLAVQEDITEESEIEDDDFDVPSSNSVPGKIMGLVASEKLYQHNRALKAGKAAELDELKIARLKGDVLPVAPIKTLVFKFKQGLLTKQKLAFASILNEIKQKYELTTVDMAHYIGLATKAANAAEIDATAEFIRDLDDTLIAYTVKRSNG